MAVGSMQRNSYESGGLRDGDGPPTEYSVSSSQTVSGPLSTSEGESSNNYAGLELSIGSGLSNDESYFILDEGGNHVLDNQGIPARARRWQPTNINQRERYTRLQLSTKGPGATYKWLQSVLVSPDHLKIPKVQTAHHRNTTKDSISGSTSVTSAAASPLNATDTSGGSSVSIGRRRKLDVVKHRQVFLVEERRRKRPKELDGFMLMDACGCNLPDEGQKADVSGRGLVGVVQEDLKYFARLKVLDAGDNSLACECFTSLPQLEDLSLPCNNIRDIRVDRKNYLKLQRLDLSYNNLSTDALAALGQLPNLLDLDLTCNGLTCLPSAMGHLMRLQRLSLERNQLDSEKVFDVLSTLPALLELNLAFNYFTSVRFTPELAKHAFLLLEELDLGFNYIAHEADIEGLALLERLQRIILYGNPLAGPTGEDPLGLCVEALINKADRVREGWSSNPIEVITEMPRKSQSHGGGSGGGGGRRRPYSDIGITMVHERSLPPASKFREAGNKSLFRFESDLGEGIVQATLRAAHERFEKQNCGPAGSSTKESDYTFLTSVARQDDGVDPLPGNKNDAVEGFTSAKGSMGSMSTRLLRRPLDPIVRGDPVKLRMAFTALRYMLKHPVTSSMDVPCQSSSMPTGSARAPTDSGVARKTAAARARQLPRRPYQLLKSKREVGARLFSAPRAGSDLGKLNHVLTSMGEALDRMALEKQASNNVRAEPPGLSSIIDAVNAVMDETEY